MVKSWPAKYGCQANDMAIQVLGGSGYTRDYLLEQLYRDQRLNPIHEGTEGVQALDLLGRKIEMADGAAFAAFVAAVGETVAAARGKAALQSLADAIAVGLGCLQAVTTRLTEVLAHDPDRALANATVYLDAFGRVVAAWVWLQQALAASEGMQAPDCVDDADFYKG